MTSELCPVCGKPLTKLACGHCGSKLPKAQAADLSAAWSMLAKLQSDGWKASDAPHREESNHERYTPSPLVESARRVLGKIDLDPASSKEANRVVQAELIFTKRDDGLKQPWKGCVFLNPPFDDWPSWMAKLNEELESRRVREAVIIGPANITAFRPLLRRGGLLLVPDERPKFYDQNGGTLIAPPFGSLICYVGQNHHRFTDVFEPSGIVLRALPTNAHAATAG